MSGSVPASRLVAKLAHHPAVSKAVPHGDGTLIKAYYGDGGVFNTGDVENLPDGWEFGGFDNHGVWFDYVPEYRR